jgi:hypothetical protein
MESIIRDHVLTHFITNQLFSDKQYGFIRHRSTVLQLLTVIDLWTNAIDEGYNTDVIYTDFEKAFDKVPHKRLLSKLQSYGISAEIIVWIEDFLCHREHCVKINGTSSKTRTVRSGIPQGSVLGPLLFVIYINDLPELCAEFGELFLFADDAKFFRTIKTSDDIGRLQLGLNMLTDWSNRWLLRLNVTKCVFLPVGTAKDDYDHGYYLNENGNKTKLIQVSSTKDLGITIDSGLTYIDHITLKIHKAYSMLGIIKRNFKDMDKNTFIKLYKSMVRSHLEYATSVWSPHRKLITTDLEKVQKRATKMIRQLRKCSYENRLNS